jgi:hypothetical protein
METVLSRPMKLTVNHNPRSQSIRMPRWKVAVPRWRELVVEQVHIEPTYLGYLEGKRAVAESVT